MNLQPLGSFGQLSAALQQGTTTCQATVDHCLQNIAQGTPLNAFVRTYTEEARQRATVIDQKYRAGSVRSLGGMVVGLKDMLCYQDHPVEASSKILKGFIAQFNATVTQRLLEADAILIGHQNCDQFGMGSSNENSVHGPARNAADTTRVPGGSSGGSAVAVQAHMCHASLGTDTGGSVRQPAAFCGIVGLKPTYGRVSRHGMIAYASSFDTVGILAPDVRDCAAVLEVIAGADTLDSTASRQPVPLYTAQLSFDRRAKVAYFPEALEHPGLQPEIRAQTQATLDLLRQEGHQVGALTFPLLAYALPTYYILTNAEASANLARFDGVRYGYRSPQCTTLSAMYQHTRTEGFSLEVQRRILTGTFLLSAHCYDAWYIKAQQVRRLIRDQLAAILADYDFVVLPTTPTSALR